jgi:large subunit ribosomal protein L47
MAAIPTFRTLRPHLNLAAMPTDAVLPFLVPSAQCLRAAPVSRFSTTPSRCKGKREKNKLRGVSPVRGTGLQKRQVLSVTAATGYDKMKLAKPTKPVTEVQGDPNHGLWDFFKDKKLLQTPVDEAAHGMEPMAATAR